MSATTKITVLLILILRLLGSGLGIDTGFGPQLTLLSQLAYLFLIVHLLGELKTSFLVYSAVLILMLIGTIGEFLRVMHWSGGSELFFLGKIGLLIGGGLLIWSSLKSGKTLIIHLLLGFCILIQVGVPMVLKSKDFTWHLGLLNYPIAALACTILLNQQDKNKGERNILVIIALMAVFYIFNQSIALL